MIESLLQRTFGASYRTSATGTGAFLIVIGDAMKAYFDIDPLTNPNWTLLAAALFGWITALRVRDNAVSSEKAGAK